MALTPEQIQQMNQIVGNAVGKSKSNPLQTNNVSIQDAIANFRSQKVTQPTTQVPENVSRVQTALGQIEPRQSDIGSDIRMAGREIKQSFQKAGERVQEAKVASDMGEQSQLRGVLQGLGYSAGFLANTIGTAIKTAVKIPLTQEQENSLKQSVAETVQNLAQTEFGQKVSEEAIEPAVNWYNNLSPEQKRDIDAVGGITALLTEIIPTVGPAKRIAQTAVESAVDFAKTAKQIGLESFDQARGSLQKQWDNLRPEINQEPLAKQAESLKPVTIEEAMKSPEFGITEEIAGFRNIGDKSKFLTKAEKERLLKIDPKTGNEYIDTFLKREDSDVNPTVFNKAVNDTKKAINEYRKEVGKTGSLVGAIKEKLRTLPVGETEISNIVDEMVETLKSKGLQYKKGKFTTIKGVNTPFSKSDINAINNEIAETLKNIRNSKTMENLLLGMERLDNKINFNVSSDLTGSLQGLAKTVRAKLKAVRNKSLDKDESKIFEQYSQAEKFIERFEKGDFTNKISTLLNRFGSKRDMQLVEVAEEIKRVTGIDIMDYASLARILSESAGSQSSQRSLLNQYIGEAMTLSPTGIVSGTVSALANKIINVDKLKEVQKAINYRY